VITLAELLRLIDRVEAGTIAASEIRELRAGVRALAYQASLARKLTPLSVSCGYCGAEVGQDCRSVTGSDRPVGLHTARVARVDGGA